MSVLDSFQRGPWRAVGAGVATLLLLLACFPPFGLGSFAWLALVPLLSVLPRLSWRGVEWLGFLTGFAFYAISFRWFWALFGYPAISLWGLLALFFAGFCVLARTLPREMPAWRRALLTGCFWVALEFIRAEQWPLRFSWLSLGYSQHDQFAVLPAAGWIGVYGLSFLLVAMSAAVAARARAAIALAAVIGLASAWVALQPSAPQRVAPGKMDGRVVLVQSESHLRVDLYALSERALRDGPLPTLVVWPEYVEQFTETESPQAYAEIRDWADQHDVTLIFGGMTDRGGEAFSSAAFVVGPDGADLGVYEKHNPLPFFQDGRPGTEYPLFAWRTGDRHILFGNLICFDVSFERNARMLARNGAENLVVPSTEPSEWPRLEQAQHAIIAPLRAVENDVGILRASSPGPSQVVDPRGGVARSFPAGRDGVLVCGMPFGGTGQTLYNRVGWVLPWVCQVVTAVWIVRCVLIALRGRREIRPVRSVVDELSAEGTH